MTVTTQINAKKAVAKQQYPTLEEIRKAIPQQCWEKSLPKSVFFLVLDFAILYGMYKAVPYFESYGWAGLIIWYWFMGMFGSSLFIVGHDAGHGSFSEYEWANDLFGHIAHAPILAPFWPWQKSHRQHHQYTSHLTKDMGHPWVTEDDHSNRSAIEQHFAKFPLSGFFRWNPIYTVLGLPDGSHFWPGSRLFTTTADRVKCVVSGLACLVCAIAAFHICDYSVFTYFKYYLVPLSFQGFWLVIITYLQHQNETITIYEEGEWNYVKGQVETIDRVYGFGIDTLIHHITDGHVAHHFFFTKIPHYHLPEATKALRKVLEPYGLYKRETNYDFLIKYLWYNIKLEYLVGKGTGILRYNCLGDEEKKQH